MSESGRTIDQETLAEIEDIIQSQKGYEYAKFFKYIKETFFLILVFFIGLFILFKIEFPPNDPRGVSIAKWFNLSDLNIFAMSILYGNFYINFKFIGNIIQRSIFPLGYKSSTFSKRKIAMFFIYYFCIQQVIISISFILYYFISPYLMFFSIDSIQTYFSNYVFLTGLYSFIYVLFILLIVYRIFLRYLLVFSFDDILQELTIRYGPYHSKRISYSAIEKVRINYKMGAEYARHYKEFTLVMKNGKGYKLHSDNQVETVSKKLGLLIQYEISDGVFNDLIRRRSIEKLKLENAY